jgi:3-hydroxyisobutyrate dehydrogenase-like beta-hydroxyacid dehydrogenase
MARNICAKANLTHPLLIFNRTVSRAQEFAAAFANPSSVQVAENVVAAVKPADIVFTSLGDDASVVAIYDEILAAGPVTGKLFIETSTILPETTNEIAEKVLAAGAEFVASPGRSPQWSICAVVRAEKLVEGRRGPKSLSGLSIMSCLTTTNGVSRDK